jgi:putative molybdopterin biosynthesis protein
MKEQNIYIANRPLAEARAAWHDALTSCGFFGTTHQHRVQVVDALGKRTAEPVFARHSSPSYNAAAMDGIAVHFGELIGASEANPICLSPDRYRHVNTGNAVTVPHNINRRPSSAWQESSARAGLAHRHERGTVRCHAPVSGLRPLC